MFDDCIVVCNKVSIEQTVFRSRRQSLQDCQLNGLRYIDINECVRVRESLRRFSGDLLTSHFIIIII